jgi:tetratricopeptide (TPR) repeat protein
MDATFRPKLLDLVEFPATLIGDEAAGTAQGTVVEDFGTALLVEVYDDQGIPTDFATIPVEAAKTLWPAPDQGTEAPDPVGAEGHFEKGLLLLQNGLFRDAKQEFRAAFELEPRFAGTLMNIASEPAKAGNYDVAIGLYQLVLELQPENQLTQHNLAAALIDRGIAFSLDVGRSTAPLKTSKLLFGLSRLVRRSWKRRSTTLPPRTPS